MSTRAQPRSATTEKQISHRGLGQPPKHRFFAETIDQPPRCRLTVYIANQMVASTSEGVPCRPGTDSISPLAAVSNILLRLPHNTKCMYARVNKGRFQRLHICQELCPYSCDNHGNTWNFHLRLADKHQ